MYKGKKISLVIPAYKEERLIRATLEKVPDLFDTIYVVDDYSPDQQNQVVLQCAQKDPRITLLQHRENQGPGAAIVTGYLASSQANMDLTVVVGGDNQMLLEEATALLDPIIAGKCDYTKGNRFVLSHLEDTLEKMPRTRLIGNVLITALTKIASGF